MPTVSAEISPADQRETRTRLAFDFLNFGIFVLLAGRVLAWRSEATPLVSRQAHALRSNVLHAYNKLLQRLTRKVLGLGQKIYYLKHMHIFVRHFYNLIPKSLENCFNVAPVG